MLSRIGLALILLSILATWAGSDTFPCVVTDARGKQIRIPAAPKRIISLAPSNTEILFALGAGERVVGVTRKCDYPPAARKIAQVGDVLISVERVVSLRPDLVVAHVTMNWDVIELLERRHITVVAVNPESFADLERDIKTIGKAVGASAEAQRSCERIDGVIRRVQEQAAILAHPPRTLVIIQEWPVWVAGADSFIDQMVRIAGGLNVASDIHGFGQMSMESIVLRSPEVILVLTGGSTGFLRRAATRVTPAVREGRCRVVDPNLFVRPGPRLSDGLSELGRIFAEAVGERR